MRVAAPEVADPAHAQRGMPRVRHKRGGVFPSVRGLHNTLCVEKFTFPYSRESKGSAGGGGVAEREAEESDESEDEAAGERMTRVRRGRKDREVWHE